MDLDFDLILPFGSQKVDLSNLNIKNLDHLGLVAGFCEEVGIAKMIDELIPSSSNDKIISTGKCLEAMILNV